MEKEVERLMQKLTQDQPRAESQGASPAEEGALTETDSIEMLVLIAQTQILRDLLLESSQELIELTDGDHTLIENLDHEVAKLIKIFPYSRRSDVAETINKRRAKGTLNTLEELPDDEKIQWKNDNNPPEDKLITRKDLFRIAKVALILSISLILPSFLYFAGLQLGWALTLFVSFILVAWLGYNIK